MKGKQTKRCRFRRLTTTNEELEEEVKEQTRNDKAAFSGSKSDDQLCLWLLTALQLPSLRPGDAFKS